MSARKKRAFSDIRDVYDGIKDVLIRVKPKIDNLTPDARASLVDDLDQVVSLAESFTEKRPKSNKQWLKFADALDQEGVSLWNAAGLLRSFSNDDDRIIIAAMWHAAFRLIEAGLEDKPGIETLIHVLTIASKTAVALSEAGKRDVAGTILMSAAKFEDSLKTAEDTGNLHQEARACSRILFFSSRMEIAWKEGSEGMAEVMLEKITGQERQLLALLPPHEREVLATKLHEIGRSILRSGKDGNVVDGTKAVDAVKWMQRAFSVAEQLENAATPTSESVKKSILKTLARAYYLSSSEDPENLNRSETALQELIGSMTDPDDRANPEYQELRWLRLAVLKRRKAGESALTDAFKSIIDHMVFAESNIADILRELRAPSFRPHLVTAVNRYCLQRALEHQDELGSASLDLLLFSLIFHYAKHGEQTGALQELESEFDSVSKSGLDLSSTSAIACLTLMWQYGDRHYQTKRWVEAAGWYLAASHKIFTNMGQATLSKCYRKAALCYIQTRQFGTVHSVIRRCSSNEASTHYVIFLSAVHQGFFRQGLENEANAAILDMIETPDLEIKALLLATRIAHEADMKSLLLTILQAMAKKTKISSETAVETITLARCIIRLILKLLEGPGTDILVLADLLIQHFASVNHAVKLSSASVVAKDLSWLWRAAYNCAVRGCSEWENAELRIAQMFDISRELIEAYCEGQPMDVDPDLFTHIIDSSFASVSGKVFAYRSPEPGSCQTETLRSIVSDIEACQTRIGKLVSSGKIKEEQVLQRAESHLSTLRLFEIELLCKLSEWDQALQKIGAAVASESSSATALEAITDILWTQKEVPVAVQYSALETILRANLNRNLLSIERFSRWLRAICSILLVRNSSADRTKAIGYVEQAVDVMNQGSGDDGEDTYPIEERHWLLGTSYNTALECFHATWFDEAKRWFETATTICRFVPDGQNSATKISEAYTQLLATYKRKK